MTIDVTATGVAASATAAVESNNPHYPYGGTLVLNDSLRDNSKGYQWDVGPFVSTAACSFTDTTYSHGFVGVNCDFWDIPYDEVAYTDARIWTV